MTDIFEFFYIRPFCCSKILIHSFTLVLISFFILIIPINGNSQEEPEYEEIAVYLDIPRVGGLEVSALTDSKELLLSVTEIFNFLKIKNIPNPGYDTITGFFIDEKSVFLIDRVNNSITYQKRLFKLRPDGLMRTENNLFLNSRYFGEIFGLDCSFNFRGLIVTLNTKLDLPVIKEMRMEQMRSNIRRLKGEIKADTTIFRTYPFFKLGMLDWSVITSQQAGGSNDARFNITLGSIFACGETNLSLNYNKSAPFAMKQQYYRWRFADNDLKLLKQVVAGKINTQAISSVYSPVIGMQVTNTPTEFRQSFGTYTVSGYTEPEWIIELYVNNVLVDYAKADGSGFYKFEVPLVYGNLTITTRIYGPWGEERESTQNFTIPYNFLPKNELEYTLSAGIVEDDSNSKFSRANFHFGVNNWLTMGGGWEYLSSITSGQHLPFINTSLRLASNILLTGEYVNRVTSKYIMSFKLPSNIQLELNYNRWNPDQKAINLSYTEERKIQVSVPIRSRLLSAYTRFKFDQILLRNTKYANLELLLSGNVLGINTNLTTFAMLSGQDYNSINSSISFGFRLPGQFILTPQGQYDYNIGKFISAKVSLDKHLFTNSFLNISYENNFINKLQNIELGLRYDLSFAQAGASVRRSNKLVNFVQNAKGSLVYERESRYLGKNNRSSVGKGGIIISPYFDLNCNGYVDEGEPSVAGLNVRVNGGRVEQRLEDTTILIHDLEPYTNYYIELDRNNFDNIAWQFRKSVICVAVDPNRYKLIKLPVAVVGEASGMVYIKDEKGTKGQGRVIVCFYNDKSELVGRIMTESDGFFSYLGLVPGTYSACIDTGQLRKIKMIAYPDSIPIIIRRTRDGDIVDNLEFTIQAGILKRIPPKIKIPYVAVAPKIGFAVEIDAYENIDTALVFQKKLQNITDRHVEVIPHQGYFTVCVTGFLKRKEAILYMEELKKKGYSYLHIVMIR